MPLQDKALCLFVKTVHRQITSKLTEVLRCRLEKANLYSKIFFKCSHMYALPKISFFIQGFCDNFPPLEPLLEEYKLCSACVKLC